MDQTYVLVDCVKREMNAHPDSTRALNYDGIPEPEPLHPLCIDEAKLEDDSSIHELSFKECRNDEDSKSFQEEFIEGNNIRPREDLILPKSWKSEVVYPLSVGDVKLEDNSIQEESSVRECSNDEEDIESFLEQFIVGTKIRKREEFILLESLKSGDGTTGEVKVEDNFSEAESSIEECRNDDEDSKSFQDQIIEGEKICKREDFISHESCVSLCDETQLKEIPFPKYEHGGITEETNVKNCYRCENSSMNGRSLNSGVEKDIENIYLKEKNHQCNIDTRQKGRFEANIDDESIAQKQILPFRSTQESPPNTQIDSVHLKLKNHKCHMCEYATTQKGSLKIHIDNVHLKLKNHKCQMCEFTTGHKKNLRIHIDNIHSLLKLRNHMCRMCEFTTAYKQSLRRHIKIVHLKLGNHKCQQCEYATTQESQLKIHIDNVHLKLKNHKCHMCEFSTGHKQNLKDHIENVHLKVRNHKCQMCEYKTRRRGNLKIHMDNVHLKLKNHKCHMCDFSTGLKHNLKVHIDNVHSLLKLRNHKCRMCEFATPYKRGLQVHIETVHLKSQKSQVSSVRLFNSKQK